MDPALEYASTESLQELQLALLIESLTYVQANSPYYSRLFKTIGFDPNTFTSLEDIKSIPLTSKEDFANFNNEFLSVPKTDVADYVTTSGTLGDPVSYAISHNDLNRLAENEALSLKCAGVKPGDTISLMTTQDKRFMAGLAYTLGARKLRCGIIRNGPGVPEMQWDSILRFQPEHLIAVPSFIPKLLDAASRLGIDPNSTSVTSIICIGEPIRNQLFELNALGRRITDHWDVKLLSTYASTEMAAAFTECEGQCGGHLRANLIYLEVLDQNGQQVNSGQSGEVVITTLGVQGTPLVRYRTGDICTLHEEPCQCGRNTPRLGPVLGRKQHMIKFKGTTVYPPQMHDIMDDLPNIKDYIIRVRSDEYDNDMISIVVSKTLMKSPVIDLAKRAFKSRLRVTPDFDFVDTAEIVELKHPEDQRKAIKFIDDRLNQYK